MDISNLSEKEKAELLRKLSAEQTAKDNERKEAYESARTDFLKRVKEGLTVYQKQGREFKEWLRKESEAFFSIMKDYGKLKREDQIGFSIADENFKYQVKGCKVKGFDERADIAEKRLVEFLRGWVTNSEKGTEDPMYKLAMMMIQRNEAGDLDYKSISRLYELESDFGDPDYSEIMNLFKESNVVEKTAIHFYFEEKTEYNGWRRIEPSFNKM